jgi:triacylglycerol lipase
MNAPIPENIHLKYPVVLVHGIIAHDRRSLIKYWGRIPEVLTGKGIKVFRGNTDAWGKYQSNALILKKTIENVLSQTGAKRVNIIAHSKGGIDSRYLIWKHFFGDKIASLTTICTPHHGSEIADLLFNKKIIHKRYIRKILSIFGGLYGDANPNLCKLIYQMTTAKMKEFNEKIEMDKNVFYQSLYTTMGDSSVHKMFSYTYSKIKEISGENDGLVSENSAKWGNNINKIEGRISHAEILDYKGKNISGVNIPGIYVKIAKELNNNNF